MNNLNIHETVNPSFSVLSVTTIKSLGVVIFARQLDGLPFQLNKQALLNGVPIRGADIPRKTKENLNLDIKNWGFLLHNPQDKNKFHTEQIITLTKSIPE